MKPLISNSDLKPLNKVGEMELYASNAYRYSSTCMLSKNLLGFVKYMRQESADELEHRTKLELFANDMGTELDVPTIKAVEFPSEEPMAILQFLLKMEVELLEAYELMVEDADREAVRVLAREMVEIQTEGVGGINDLIAEVESVGVGFVNMRLLA